MVDESGARPILCGIMCERCVQFWKVCLQAVAGKLGDVVHVDESEHTEEAKTGTKSD